jgi:hypothetical protein
LECILRNLKKDEFDQYVEEHSSDNKITNGIFAPWMMYKEEFLEMGGHDPIMHSCREDSDVFNRMKLSGFEFIQPWNSLVYHLTGRGAGSFDGDKARHEQWRKDMDKSTLEFIRKWGSNVNHTALMEPIVTPKYNIAYVVKNCPGQLLTALEPWCDRIYIENQDIVDIYIDREQENTSFDLSKRVFTLENNDPIGENDIVIEFNANQLTQENFQLLMQMPNIIQESGEVGKFELDIFNIEIISLIEYQQELIKN